MSDPVVVIGGGIIGLSIAVRLRQRGAPVWLLDAAEPGMGASWGNAGHLAVEQVYPVADASMLPRLPAMLLDPLGPLRIDWRYLPRLAPWGWRALVNMLPAHAARSHRALLSINAHCLAAWLRLAKTWGLAPWIETRGTLQCCETMQTERRLRALGQHLNTLGVENVWLDRRALQAREPALAHGQRGALFYPGTGHVTDLRAISQGLLDAFLGLGGQLRTHCRVHRVEVTMGGIRLQTDQGEMRSARVVLAAGAFSKVLARQLTGVSVPLDTERGYHLMLPNERGRLNLPVASADRRFVMTPMAGGLRLAGTVEYAGLAAAPNMARAFNLRRLADGMLSEPLDETAAKPWMGFRPTTADSVPVIDRVGNVLLAFGHHHLGLTQAAATAEMIEALYFDEVSPVDTRPFRVARFAR
ncbi:MAG: FAD-dependent oxidoreductase [Lautropia sp.]|nr:FAD-dependent oxidoreductase [Lautropia sp.]